MNWILITFIEDKILERSHLVLGKTANMNSRNIAVMMMSNFCFPDKS